jgi:hypothetical protein
MTGCKQRCRLFLPRSAAQRPAIGEHDCRPRAMILVVKLNECGIFLSNLDKAAYGISPVVWMSGRFCLAVYLIVQKEQNVFDE